MFQQTTRPKGRIYETLELCCHMCETTFESPLQETHHCPGCGAILRSEWQAGREQIERECRLEPVIVMPADRRDFCLMAA